MQPDRPDPVRDHYDALLGEVFDWSLGDHAEVRRRAAAEIAGLQLPAGPVIDLGAGAGRHAIAAAEAGHAVTAFEPNETLAALLEERASGLPVTVLREDLRGLWRHAAADCGAILCLGDTLTHLPDRAAVETLLRDAAATLRPGGVLAATFRDYTKPLCGEARFIPVRSDDRRVHACCLDYAEDTVTVTDLVHDRTPAGWQFRVGSYPKLRLPPSWVVETAMAAGLDADRDQGPSGMTLVRGVRRDGAD